MLNNSKKYAILVIEPYATACQNDIPSQVAYYYIRRQLNHRRLKPHYQQIKILSKHKNQYMLTKTPYSTKGINKSITNSFSWQLQFILLPYIWRTLAFNEEKTL